MWNKFQNSLSFYQRRTIRKKLRIYLKFQKLLLVRLQKHINNLSFLERFIHHTVKHRKKLIAPFQKKATTKKKSDLSLTLYNMKNGVDLIHYPHYIFFLRCRVRLQAKTIITEHLFLCICLENWFSKKNIR